MAKNTNKATSKTNKTNKTNKASSTSKKAVNKQSVDKMKYELANELGANVEKAKSNNSNSKTSKTMNKSQSNRNCK